MAGRGRGARMKKLHGGSLEKPRPLKIQQDTAVLSSLREAEQIVYKLSDRKASLQEVSNLCSTLKRHGKELETRNEATLNLIFNTIRQAAKDQCLSSQARVLVMDVLEARARKWAGPDHVTQGHYSKKQQEMALRQKIPDPSVAGSAHIPPVISHVRPSLKSTVNVDKSVIQLSSSRYPDQSANDHVKSPVQLAFNRAGSPVQSAVSGTVSPVQSAAVSHGDGQQMKSRNRSGSPGTALRQKYSSPKKKPDKDEYVFDIGIPYQQCGKVIGVAGARIKLIEGATDTIISITKCQDRIERDAIITAKTKEDILDAVELIEKLVAMDYNDIDAYRMIQEAQDKRFVSGAKKNLLTALDDVSYQLTEGNLRSRNVSLSSRSRSPSFTGSLTPSPTPDLNSNYIVTKDMRSRTPEPKNGIIRHLPCGDSTKEILADETKIYSIQVNLDQGQLTLSGENLSLLEEAKNVIGNHFRRLHQVGDGIHNNPSVITDKQQESSVKETVPVVKATEPVVKATEPSFKQPAPMSGTIRQRNPSLTTGEFYRGQDDLNWEDLDSVTPFVFGKDQFKVTSVSINHKRAIIPTEEEIGLNEKIKVPKANCQRKKMAVTSNSQVFKPPNDPASLKVNQLSFKFGEMSAKALNMFAPNIKCLEMALIHGEDWKSGYLKEETRGDVGGVTISDSLVGGVPANSSNAKENVASTDVGHTSQDAQSCELKPQEGKVKNNTDIASEKVFDSSEMAKAVCISETQLHRTPGKCFEKSVCDTNDCVKTEEKVIDSMENVPVELNDGSLTNLESVAEISTVTTPQKVIDVCQVTPKDNIETIFENKADSSCCGPEKENDSFGSTPEKQMDIMETTIENGLDSFDPTPEKEIDSEEIALEHEIDSTVMFESDTASEEACNDEEDDGDVLKAESSVVDTKSAGKAGSRVVMGGRISSGNVAVRPPLFPDSSPGSVERAVAQMTTGCQGSIVRRENFARAARKLYGEQRTGSVFSVKKETNYSREFLMELSRSPLAQGEPQDWWLLKRILPDICF